MGNDFDEFDEFFDDGQAVTDDAVTDDADIDDGTDADEDRRQYIGGNHE